MSELTVRGGKLIRPGFYRAPDGSGANYAKQVKESGDACIFCPESLDARGIEVFETVGSAACKFYVFDAKPAYSHFDAQQVVEHRLIVPEAHIESRRELGRKALRVLDEYLYEQEAIYERRTDGLAFQSYVRSASNPSKSVGHLHTHMFGLGPNPVKKFDFDMTGGVTTLEFGELAPEQLDELLASRYKVQ